MYKSNVLNFIINTTGVVYEGNNENDKNEFIRENLPDSMDMFLNQMNGVIPNYRPYYDSNCNKIETEEPITVAQEIAIELMSNYLHESKPNFKYAYEAKEYLENGRRQRAEELAERYRNYKHYISIDISMDGITGHGEYLPERKAISLDFDRVMLGDNRTESISHCLDNLIHFGMLCND